MINLKRVPESQGWIQRIGEWAIRQHTFMPRMLDLEVSRVCNLSCPACMRRADSSLAQQGGEEFRTLEGFREVYRQIPTLGTLNFMGDGEPLVNPELNDIIHFASLQDIYTVVTTNATLLDRRIVSEWERDKVYKVHASVDSPYKDLYEEVREGAEWDKTYENLKLLGLSNIPLCINAVLTKRTIDGMPDMVKLCRDVGAREVTFLMPICTYGDDRDTRPEDTTENQALFIAAEEECHRLGVKWVFPLGLRPTFRRFPFPFIRPQISIEGDLYACCYSLGRGKVWFEGYSYDVPDYNMGNMIKSGFDEVWHNEGYKEIRRIYKETEVPKGTIITREELLRRTKEIMENPNSGRYDHCKICQARWGMACS